jgi:hypothetical protein
MVYEPALQLDKKGYPIEKVISDFTDKEGIQKRIRRVKKWHPYFSSADVSAALMPDHLVADEIKKAFNDEYLMLKKGVEPTSSIAVIRQTCIKEEKKLKGIE